MKYIKKFESQIITELNLSFGDLTELPELPDTLKEFVCANNKLTKLSELPGTLEKLFCSKNNLTELPDLPDTLKILGCKGNKLPYYDLKGYWKWFEETYPWKVAAKKYNM